MAVPALATVMLLAAMLPAAAAARAGWASPDGRLPLPSYVPKWSETIPAGGSATSDRGPAAAGAPLGPGTKLDAVVPPASIP